MFPFNAQSVKKAVDRVKDGQNHVDMRLAMFCHPSWPVSPCMLVFLIGFTGWSLEWMFAYIQEQDSCKISCASKILARSLPQHHYMVWSIFVTRISFKKHWNRILWLAVEEFQPFRWWFSWANTWNKTDHTSWKAMKTWSRNWYTFLCTNLFKVTWAF